MLPVILLVAGLLALALLVVLYWRTAQQIALLKAESERLRVVQRDMSADVRKRLEEGARTWESVEHEVRPRLDQLEPSVADLSATLEEHLPGMGEARRRLAGLEERMGEVEAELKETMGARTAEIDARFVHVEARLTEITEGVRTLRDAADERLAAAAARLDALEETAAAPLAHAGEPEGDALAAVAAAADAPATFGTSRGGRRGRKGRSAGSGRGWLFLALVLALGLVLVITSLA